MYDSIQLEWSIIIHDKEKTKQMFVNYRENIDDKPSLFQICNPIDYHQS